MGVRLIDAALIAYGRAFEHPSKIRIVRWLARRLAGGEVHVRYASGATIAIDPADYVGWTIFKTGEYEPESLNLALRLMREQPGLFVDAGANVGWYTCAVARVPGCQVISIEADCENCTALRRNIALGGLGNVGIFNGAVGPEFDAVQTVRRSQTNRGTTAVRHGDHDPEPSRDWVTTIPLETLLARTMSSPVRPVLVKIDVEGFESQVLAGVDFAGPFRPKNILMEFDRELAPRAWESFDALQVFFAAKGYEVLDVFGRPLRDAVQIPEDNVWIRERASAAGE
jgi:FkbM family methyltransferase